MLKSWIQQSRAGSPAGRLHVFQTFCENRPFLDSWNCDQGDQMRRVGFFVAVLAAALAFASCAATAGKSKLEMYTATVDRATVAKLAREGVDIAATKQVAAACASTSSCRHASATASRRQGVRLALKRNKDGLTVQQQAAAQAADGFTVWGRATSPERDSRRALRDREEESARS